MLKSDIAVCVAVCKILCIFCRYISDTCNTSNISDTSSTCVIYDATVSTYSLHK